MIFGDCNLKITNLYPRIDRNSVGDYYFSVGIKKEFAKKCFEEELDEESYNHFQNMGRRMFQKVFGSDDYMPLFEHDYPYRFFENKDGNLTCLIRNLTAPGNACGLYFDGMKNIGKELKKVDKYQKFIEYHPHNIDHPRQCYAFLSLLTSWEETMDSQFWKPDNQNP